MNDNDVAAALYAFLAAQGSITSLLANGADSIYEDEAEENAEHPHLVYNEQAGVPNRTLGDGLNFDAYVYQVKAVTTGDSAKAAAEIRDAVEAVLSDGAFTIPDRKLIVGDKISNIRMTELEGGTRYNHRGALYRMWTEPA